MVGGGKREDGNVRAYKRGVMVDMKPPITDMVDVRSDDDIKIR